MRGHVGQLALSSADIVPDLSSISRRAVLFGAPVLTYVGGMIHPRKVLVHGDPWFFIGLHLAWSVLTCLLAWMIVLLVAGISGPAATAARILAIPFAVAYTVFTTFLGTAIGAFVWKGNELPADQRPAAAALIDNVTHSSLGTPLRVTANVLWLAAVLAVIVALRRHAPLPALALVGLGAVAFAHEHERPWGPGGMAAILAGVVWLELRPRPAGDPRLGNRLRFGR